MWVYNDFVISSIYKKKMGAPLSFLVKIELTAIKVENKNNNKITKNNKVYLWTRCKLDASFHIIFYAMFVLMEHRAKWNGKKQSGMEHDRMKWDEIEISFHCLDSLENDNNVFIPWTSYNLFIPFIPLFKNTLFF